MQEVQLAAPRSTEGVTDNQHGERERRVRRREEGETEIQKRGGDEGEMYTRRRREREKLVITQMGRYAPSIHPMLPYHLAHATRVLIGPVHSVCSSTLQVWRRALLGNAVSSVMLEIYDGKVGRRVRSICGCVCAHAYVCVCSNEPATHIYGEYFISSHVDNEQLEFW